MTMKNFYDAMDEYGMYDNLYFEVEDGVLGLADEQIMQPKSDADLDAWLKEATAFYEKEKNNIGKQLRKALQKPNLKRSSKKDYDRIKAELKSISWDLNRIANVLEEVVPNNKTVSERLLQVIRKDSKPKKNMGEYIKSGEYLKDKEAGESDEK